MTYREMMSEENDEIMVDLRKRQAEVRSIRERFGEDSEGFNRFMEAELAKLGFCYKTGTDGATYLTKTTSVSLL